MYSPYLAMYRFIADRLGPAHRILDLSCGEGYGMPVLAARGATVLGLDIAPEAVLSARTRWASNGARLAFLVADGTRLPLADASVAAVCSVETLEHIDDDAAFLREIARVLQPGAVAAITTPNRERPGSRSIPPNPYHVREYAPAEFDSLLRAVFSRVRVLGLQDPRGIHNPESRRARTLGLLNRIDFLRLRRLLPRRLRNLAMRRTGVVLAADIQSEDFSISHTDVERAIHLIALCSQIPHSNQKGGVST
jgi:SAM-dependent methyltransferase